MQSYDDNSEETKGTARDIAEPFAAQISALLGPVEVQWVSGNHPGIPSVLQGVGSGPPASKVLAVTCGKGLVAVVTKPDGLEQVQVRCSVFQLSPVILWAGYHILFGRVTEGTDEKPMPAEPSLGLGCGAFLIRQGLIPVADLAAGGLSVVRLGAVPPLTGDDLQDLIKKNHSKPQESERDWDQSSQQHRAPETHSSDAAAGSASPLKKLEALFGEDSVVESLQLDDPRIPSSLGCRDSRNDGGKFFGIQCRARAKQHLIAVLFHEPAALESFGRSNQTLCTTAIFYGSLSALLMLVEGRVPHNLRTRNLTWVAEGVIPVPYEAADALPDAPQALPRTLFDDINWDPQVLQAFTAAEIQKEFGDPFLPAERRAVVLNPLFLAELLLKQHTLSCDRDKENFLQYDAASGRHEKISRKEIFALVTDRLLQLSRDFPNHLRPSDINKSMVKQVVWFMEILGSAEQPSEEEICRRFFAEAYESCEGAKLTQDEAFKGLGIFCRLRKWDVPSRAFFDRAATAKFGETSHCFGENGNLRGRVGWRLRYDVIKNPGVERKPQAHKLNGVP